jgi:hypothetical protein
VSGLRARSRTRNVTDGNPILANFEGPLSSCHVLLPPRLIDIRGPITPGRAQRLILRELVIGCRHEGGINHHGEDNTFTA